MIKSFQHTLAEHVSLEGIGLHTGKKSKIKVFPAENDQGIVFKRTDLKDKNLVKAKYNNVTSAKLCTTLENNSGTKVSTVEHLLAALYVCDVDNAMIEIDSEEVPIMDGSAKDFIEAFERVGIKKLSKKRKYIKIIDKFILEDGERRISLEPADNSSFEVDFQLNYQNKIIGKQKNIVNFQTDELEDVMHARTFCLYEDIEKIKKLGLAKGGSLDNAIVVDKDKVLNEGGLRNNKEFVNHKILDLAGDFLLLGLRVIGSVKCYQGGHELTNMFLRKLVDAESVFTKVEVENIFIPKKTRSNHPLKIAVNA